MKVKNWSSSGRNRRQCREGGGGGGRGGRGGRGGEGDRIALPAANRLSLVNPITHPWWFSRSCVSQVDDPAAEEEEGKKVKEEGNKGEEEEVL